MQWVGRKTIGADAALGKTRIIVALALIPLVDQCQMQQAHVRAIGIAHDPAAQFRFRRHAGRIYQRHCILLR